MKENISLNPRISPLYQAIRTIDKQAIPSGAPDANYFEPFHITEYAVIHFTKLMIAYTDIAGK